MRLAWQSARLEERPRKLYYLMATPATIAADRLPTPPLVTTHVFVRESAPKRLAFDCYASQRYARARLDRFIDSQGDWEVFSLADGRLGLLDATGLELDLFE